MNNTRLAGRLRSLSWLFGIAWRLMASGALMGASNFSTLAVVTISLLGLESGVAPAMVTGALVEVVAYILINQELTE